MPSKPRTFSLLLVPLLVTGAIAVPLQHSAIAQVFEPGETSAQIKSAQTVTQQFFTSLVEQKFEQSRQYAAPGLRNSWTASQLQQQWEKLLKITGPFVQVLAINPGEIIGGYSVIATIKFKNSTEDFLLILNPNQQITAVNFLWLGNIQTNAEQFVGALSNGNYGTARSYLARNLKETFTPEVLKQRWQAIVATMGGFKRLAGSRVVRGSSGTDAVIVNLEFEKYTGNFIIVFDPLSQIVGVNLPKKQP